MILEPDEQAQHHVSQKKDNGYRFQHVYLVWLLADARVANSVRQLQGTADLYGLFKCFTRLELDAVGSFDLDRFAGLGITARACFTPYL